MFRQPVCDEIAMEFRAKADEFREQGAGWQAKSFEWCAEYMVSRMAAWLNEPLTVRTYALETGRSEATIRRAVKKGALEKGALENVAKPGEPIHIRRGTVAICRGILTLEEDNKMKKERRRKL